MSSSNHSPSGGRDNDGSRKRPSDSAHTPRPKWPSVTVVKWPNSPPAVSPRPSRRAAEESKQERRTSGLFEGGALDSQVTDSQYIDSLGTIKEPDMDEGVAGQSDGGDAMRASSEAFEDEYPPGQLEYYERHGGLDAAYADLAAHEAQTAHETAKPPVADKKDPRCEPASPPHPGNQSPPRTVPEIPKGPTELDVLTYTLSTLDAEDRQPIADIAYLITWYREDANRSRKRIYEVERAHHMLEMRHRELTIVNERIMAALDAAGVPLPPGVIR
ncbi:hypothetical protein C8Q77DRAFT_1070660 [Trametes polyzona]|nr:hypothetical protein C8Q77DRAFT_1070660 [Trametes polyzona]